MLSRQHSTITVHFRIRALGLVQAIGREPRSGDLNPVGQSHRWRNHSPSCGAAVVSTVGCAAPVAAGLAQGEPHPGSTPPRRACRNWPDDLADHRLCRSLRQHHDRPAGGSAASQHGTRGHDARVRARTSATCAPAPSCGTPTPTGSPKSRRTAPARRPSSNSLRAPGWRCASARLTVVTPSRPAYVRARSWGVAKR